ncbi:ABC transporter substrate-binding protein [Nonomuraea basaltis]|uniref:ABC transporter substrate-binding protein n=1 Tax=Nonomuraea basaltis TaxID=2495887 RepID=UPI001485F041|nr:NrtA/SsuA/CpmA family ABC transporter substrate-binding protein [Nonomuraea basaltis]
MALLFAVLCGCGSPATNAGTAKGLGPTKALTTVTVGIMPIPDCATILLAQARHYFEAEGLKVETVTVQGGGTALPQLENGSLQFSIMNYPAAVMYEQAKPEKMKIVAPAYQAKPGTFALMVPKNSPIRSLTDLRGRHFGVATFKSISTVTTKAALKLAGLTERDVTMSETPLPDMIVALENGHRDVAWMTEPYITLYGQKAGGRVLYDVMQGQTEGLPIAGWATPTDYAKNNPEQVAGFPRAVMKAQFDVAMNEQLVRSTLPDYTKIDAETAATITLGDFPTNLHPNRIQQVADLMLEYGEIGAPIDVRAFLLPLPALTHTPAPPPPPSPPSLPSSPEAVSAS